jgi:alkyl sulfatase BDS1-like metallo-beta-lactamase superfamily hydrolase
MPDDVGPERKAATEATRRANRAVGARLPLDDPADWERVERGRVAQPSSPQVMAEGGWAVWDLDRYAFLEGDAPDTVNPSLWRQAQLNSTAGLFEVAPGFFQVRGLDLANVTFVQGDTGWLVIDPLTSSETARAALDLLHAHVPERPVQAVIYTHSHVDHFAGVRGIVDEADVRNGGVPVIAPEGFLAEAISENVIAGTVMSRRATYMYGPLLPADPQGHVDAGLGKGVPVFATAGLIAPTVDVSETGTELEVDGIRIVFQVTPGTEAPAEMNFHFPDHRVLCMAENCTATFHNVYTPRGAQVRDALAWSTYIQESIELFADDTDVVFASHHWPRWGEGDVRTYLARQRDLYRYVHDQTMRLANHGLTATEIAEELALPESLATELSARDYYGTLNHNAKAVYQRYLGWFDGNPAHLHPHPPVAAARRYVEFMGGADEVLRKARASFDDGDYRWVAEVVNHVVFAHPDHDAARHLQADALEQLGYQSESGPWRDFYLTGAQELRTDTPALKAASTAGPEVVAAMTTEMLLELLAVRLDGPAAGDRVLELTLEVSGSRGSPDEVWCVGLANGALHHVAGRPAAEPVATLRLDHLTLVALATGTVTLDELLADGRAEVGGGKEAVAAVEDLFTLFDTFQMGFPIVTP